MTKTPREFEPPKPITKAEREARKAFRQVDAEKVMTEHEIAQKAFHANRERLKAERLAREAAETPGGQESQDQEGPLKSIPFRVASANGTIVADLSMLGIAGPSLKQGTARTTYFEPGGVSF